MFKDFLVEDLSKKIPRLMFHTMTDCGDFIAIFGGLSSVDKISGDLHIIKHKDANIFTASYEKNKLCKYYKLLYNLTYKFLYFYIY